MWAFLVVAIGGWRYLRVNKESTTLSFYGMVTKVGTMNIFHELQRVCTNVKKLHNKNIKILVSAENFITCRELFENVKLLPIIQNHQIGFINKDGEIIIKPIYSDYQGLFLNSSQSKVCVKKDEKWGIIDSTGFTWVNFEYDYILPEVIDYALYPFYSRHLYSINKNHQWAVINDSDFSIDKVVDFGIYDWIDGYDSGLARVKKRDKWGIIDYTGKLVLPLEYDNIWNFYNKKRNDTIVEKGMQKRTIRFSELNTMCEDFNDTESYEDDDSNNYSSIYRNPYYNGMLDLDQQSPDFWDSL